MRHIAVFIAQDKEGKVLLQHRSSDARFLPDHWAFFGGGIEQGETPEQAVRREAREELQIELANLRFFKQYFFPEVGVDIRMFLCDLEHRIETLRAQQQEGQGLGLFARGEVRKLKMSEWDRKIVEEVLTKHG